MGKFAQTYQRPEQFGEIMASYTVNVAFEEGIFMIFDQFPVVVSRFVGGFRKK